LTVQRAVAIKTFARARFELAEARSETIDAGKINILIEGDCFAELTQLGEGKLRREIGVSKASTSERSTSTIQRRTSPGESRPPLRGAAVSLLSQGGHSHTPAMVFAAP
jgi:hypothetical protein